VSATPSQPERSDQPEPAGALAPDEAARLMLRMVNAARGAAGVPPVAWSAEAAKLAQDQADAMAQGHFGAHYDRAGQRPELRWNKLGGTDYVAENVVYYEIAGAQTLTPALLWQVTEDWITSTSHFANLADWHHTDMGFGISIVQADGSSYVGAAQEFITDLGDFVRLPDEARPGDTLALDGTALPARVELLYVGLARDDLPQPMTPEELDQTGSPYPFPSVERKVPAADLGYDLATGHFGGEIRLPELWTHYALHVTAWARYEDDPGDAEPFCIMDQVVLVP
jgi:uncharacterized protein YkwD